MEHAADRVDTPERAALVGRLLGHEAAWEHQGMGLRAGGEELEALARSHWEAEGRRLAGSDADYLAFFAGFLDAYYAA
jgi:hypothetical protein